MRLALRRNAASYLPRQDGGLTTRRRSLIPRRLGPRQGDYRQFRQETAERNQPASKHREFEQDAGA
jgi:hypothetical protein